MLDVSFSYCVKRGRFAQQIDKDCSSSNFTSYSGNGRERRSIPGMNRSLSVFTAATSLPLLLLVLLLVNLLEVAEAACPNHCNANGVCDKYGRCSCAEGYQGADCSEKVCAFAAAWSDAATATDVAHAEAECSSRGLCNRVTGKCECMVGFTGAACERLDCANRCSQHGICHLMKDLAKRTRNELSQQFTYSTQWDADKIAGCSCDFPQIGFDCSRRECPRGDDPLTTAQVNEVQVFTCLANRGSFVFFYDGEASATIPFTANAAAVKKALLAIPKLTGVKVHFSQIHGTVCQPKPNVVTVEFTEQFGAQNPLLPQLDATMAANGGSIQVSADGATTLTDVSGTQFRSVKGTKENDICSNRGLCDYSSGVCQCFDTNGDKYGSSDGYGSAGTRGDCGYVFSSTASTGVTTCPGTVPCSGHGVCDASTFRCFCSRGFSGGDCSLRECPSGRSWFAYPTDDEAAHLDYAECSNMGLCDQRTGICNCRSGFYGEACEYSACGGSSNSASVGSSSSSNSGSSSSNSIGSSSSGSSSIGSSSSGSGSSSSVCSGHGRCMSMAELALWANNNGDATEFIYGSEYNNFATWDFDRVHGCHCDDGFRGYDCSLIDCPIGDDPGTYDDHSEVQLLQCVANTGNFTLSFRQQQTRLLSFNITATELREALVALPTIVDVEVTFIFDTLPPNGTLNYIKPLRTQTEGFPPWGGFIGPNKTFQEHFVYVDVNATEDSPFCRSDGTQIAILHFQWTHGDLPEIIPDTHLLGDLVNDNGEPGSGEINVFSDGEEIFGLGSIRGSTETDFCNNRGLCDFTSGECHCFEDWTSSDGRRQGGKGFTRDCGYRNDQKV